MYTMLSFLKSVIINIIKYIPGKVIPVDVALLKK